MILMVMLRVCCNSLACAMEAGLGEEVMFCLQCARRRPQLAIGCTVPASSASEQKPEKFTGDRGDKPEVELQRCIVLHCTQTVHRLKVSTKEWMNACMSQILGAMPAMQYY